jgi:hypothetical protein
MVVQHKEHSVLAEAEKRVRAERNKRLDEADIIYCNADKWGLMDEPTKTAWRDYKDQLREIPDQSGFPFDVIWPDIPEALTR